MRRRFGARYVIEYTATPSAPFPARRKPLSISRCNRSFNQNQVGARRLAGKARKPGHKCRTIIRSVESGCSLKKSKILSSQSLPAGTKSKIGFSADGDESRLFWIGEFEACTFRNSIRLDRMPPPRRMPLSGHSLVLLVVVRAPESCAGGKTALGLACEDEAPIRGARLVIHPLEASTLEVRSHFTH